MSLQSRSDGGGEIQKSRYDGSQLLDDVVVWDDVVALVDCEDLLQWPDFQTKKKRFTSTLHSV